VDFTLTSSELGRVAITEVERMIGLRVAAVEVHIEAVKAGP
jgi:uncharacterized alkaline shock family protein YloU